MSVLYVEVLPDGCRCRWVNRSESSGWELVTWDRFCQAHGMCKAYIRYANHSVPCGQMNKPDGTCPGGQNHMWI